MAGSMDRLLEKRRELMARRRQLKGELTRLGADVADIDRVFRMVEPDYRPETPDKTSPNRHASAKNPFPPGKMTVAMLEALRLLDRPVTSAECATAMLANGGFDVDGETTATVVNRVSALLGQKAGEGQIERAGHGEGRQVLWRIVR